MLIHCSVEGNPLHSIRLTFDVEGANSFLSDIRSEHIDLWTDNEAEEPQQVDAIDVFCDDGSFPLLKGEPSVLIVETTEPLHCDRLTFIGTAAAIEQQLCAPIHDMLSKGESVVLLKYAVHTSGPNGEPQHMGHPVAISFRLKHA